MIIFFLVVMVLTWAIATVACGRMCNRAFEQVFELEEWEQEQEQITINKN